MPLMRPAVAGFLLLGLAAACSSGETFRDSAGGEPPGASAEQTPPADGPLGPDGAVPPAAADGGMDAGDAGPPPVPYQHFDVNHVLSTGQSNAVANDGKPVLSTTQPYGNLMFDTGVMTGGSCDGDGCRVYQQPTAFVPLVEGDVFFSAVETMSAGLANEAAKLAREKYLVGKPVPTHDVLVSLHGRSGNSYSCLRKGGCGWWPGRGYIEPFAEGMMQVTDGLALAEAAGKTYVVRAVTAIHGEHDHYNHGAHFPMPGTDGKSTLADYSDALEEWQRDFWWEALEVDPATGLRVYSEVGLGLPR